MRNKNYVFYLDDRKSIENEEIRKVINHNGFICKTYNQAGFNPDTFWNELETEHLKEGHIPVLVGWNSHVRFAKQAYVWNGDHKEYGNYQIVLIRTDNPLLLQVLDFLGQKPSKEQMLHAWFHRKSLSELSRDFTPRELNTYAEWETLKKTSVEEFAQLSKDIRNAQKIGKLWYAGLLSKNGEALAVTDAFFFFAEDHDIFLTFRDGTAPKFIGSSKIVNKLADKFDGIYAKNCSCWWGSSANQEEIKEYIFSIYL